MKIFEAERARLLSRVTRILAIIGAVAYIPSAYTAVKEGIWAVAVVDTVTFAAVILITLIPGISYRLRLFALIVLSLAIAGIVLVFTGPLGAGYIWFIAAILLAALFGDDFAAYSTIFAVAAFLIIYGVALAFGLEGWGLTPRTVLIIGSNLMVISTALAVIIRMLQRRLSKALEMQRSLAIRLRQELSETEKIRDELTNALEAKDTLLQEVQHRVNNNMQTILSLMDLDGSESPEDRTVRRRIRILSAANELIYFRSQSLGADLLDIVRAVVDLEEEDAINRGALPQGEFDFSGYESSCFLQPQCAIMTAICLGDAFAALKSLDSTLRIEMRGKPSVRRIEISTGVGVNARTVEGILRNLALGPLAWAASDYVEYAFLPPRPGRGPGIAVELR